MAHLPVKKLSAILCKNTSKYHGDFNCLNCLHSFAIENKRAFHEKVCENKDHYSVVMPSEDTKILKFNQNKKSNNHL